MESPAVSAALGYGGTLGDCPVQGPVPGWRDPLGRIRRRVLRRGFRSPDKIRPARAARRVRDRRSVPEATGLTASLPQPACRNPAALQVGVQEDVVHQLPVRIRQIVPGRIKGQFQKTVQHRKPEVAWVLLRSPVVE